MQRPPEWINADYAKVVTDHDIMLSFTIDPMSEIRVLQPGEKDGLLTGNSPVYTALQTSAVVHYMQIAKRMSAR